MDEVKITEEHASKIVWVETPKRKERIKLYVPLNGFNNWAVCYENGSKIPELLGVWLSKREALKAVSAWLRKTKMSQGAKHDEWFGEDQKKEIKRKPVSATKSEANNG